MKQADDAFTTMLAGHQRRSIFQRGPAFRRQHRIRFGKHLAADGDVLRYRQAGEWPVGGERGEGLGLFPCEAAAKAAAAVAQLDRDEIVIGLRQVRPRKADQYAALCDPGRKALANFGRQRPDVGKHHHRQLLVEKLSDYLLRGTPLAQSHIREWRQRAGEIERRGQQRLRGVTGGSADDADRAPSPAFVQQLYRARRTLSRDLEARDVVAQFDRKIERGLGLASLWGKGIAR